MKNMYGEIVKPQYEVAIKRWSSLQPIEKAKELHDTETFAYIPVDNYRDAVASAKEYSKCVGETIHGDDGDGEIVDVLIVCYYQDEISSYNIAWEEYYVNGKKNERVQFQ